MDISRSASQKLGELLSEGLNGAPAHLDIRPRAPLPHQSNQLYDLHFEGRRFIIKEYLKPQEFTEAPWREYRALQLLDAYDIAPRPVYFHPGSQGETHPIVVYEYMVGEMWDRKKPAVQGLRALAEMWIRMNSLEVAQPWPARSDGFPTRAQDRLESFLGEYVGYCELEYRPGLRAAAQIQELFEKRKVDVAVLSEMEAHRCFSRADPRFANILERPHGRVGMVDWEDSGWVDPALDIADLLTHPNQEDLLSNEEWGEFLEPYARSRIEAGDEEFRYRRQLYEGIITLYRLSMFLRIGLEKARAGEQAGWEINGLSAGQRLGRYMIKSRIWPETDIRPHRSLMDGLSFYPGI